MSALRTNLTGALRPITASTRTIAAHEPQAGSMLVVRELQTTSVMSKDVTEKAKEIGHEANMKAGKAADKVLEQLEKASNAFSETVNQTKGKSAVEAAKDLGNKANMAAGQGLAQGIDGAEEATRKAQDKLGVHSTQEAKEKANKATGYTQAKAEDTAQSVKREVNKATR